MRRNRIYQKKLQKNGKTSELEPKWAQVEKGKTEKIVAKLIGKSRTTYQRLKTIRLYGIPDLIAAINSKLISINRAAEIIKDVSQHFERLTEQHYEMQKRELSKVLKQETKK